MFVPVMHNLLLDRILFSLMSVRLKVFVNWFDKILVSAGIFFNTFFYSTHISQRFFRKLWPD